MLIRGSRDGRGRSTCLVSGVTVSLARRRDRLTRCFLGLAPGITSDSADGFHCIGCDLCDPIIESRVIHWLYPGWTDIGLGAV